MSFLFSPVRRYMNWLHTRWPAGTVEKLPEVRAGGLTSVEGVRIVGDLTGIPLLKFSADSGARAVQDILEEEDFKRRKGVDQAVLDLVIVGAGVSGMAAAIEAKKKNLRFKVIEAAQPFSTIVNFPKGKPIYTYPREMVPAGDLQFRAEVKEGLLDELKEQQVQAGVEIDIVRIDHLERKKGEILLHHAEGRQTRALRVIIGIGRSGNFRKLGCPGEDLEKVYNRLHDPKDFCGKKVLVVGGGDSALEAVVALAGCGAHVTLSYRKPELTRPKPENVDKVMRLVKDPSAPMVVEQPTSERVTTATNIYMREGLSEGSVALILGSTVQEVRENEAVLEKDGETQVIENDAVFSMIGREPPLDFFRRSGISIRGEWRLRAWLGLLLFFGFCTGVYHWKNFGPVKRLFAERGWFPNNMPALVMDWLPSAQEPAHLLGTLALTMKDPSFYYSLAYSICILVFGIRRIKRRQTPYVTRQTLSLMAIQIVPLFLLPFILLPWLAHNGAFGDRMVVEILPEEFRAQWTTILKEVPAKPPPLKEGAAAEAVEWRLAKKGAYENGLWLARERLVQGNLLPKALREWEWPKLESGGPKQVVFIDAGHSAENRWKRRAEIELKKGIVHVIDWDKPYGTVTKKTGWVVDSLCPIATYDLHGREYWRASGLILAWPLFIWNVFTGQPMWLWLIISLIQTFVIIPLLIYRYGKGAYCGWICSCGALAETMGDTHRHKMPHGPFWNRMNMIGQVFLAGAFVLLALRVGSWIEIAWYKEKAIEGWFNYFLSGIPVINYSYTVDLWWAGILGLGLYFHFSGRVWCRFACPLAALMHIYSRFSRFRIFPEKKKCISCNVCTSVCHQGIDIMNFANKGQPMQDPECVRCSACVNECPTGVLSFGRLDGENKPVLDTLQASPVQMQEGGSSV